MILLCKYRIEGRSYIKQMNIGEKIKTERLRQNLKQRELAKLANISGSFLSDIESGRTTPSVKSLQKISKALGVECFVFLKEEN